MVSGGITPTPTCDGNGNQTSAIPATLTWNALNQPITVNSTSATYDALGRMVEKGVGSTYTQFVYNPDGTNLAVYSGGLTKGTISLPGGSTAVYNASGLNYIRHKDWLGSSRLATTWAHAVYSKEAYAPFGETYNEAGTADRSFTGQDQNVVTNSGGTGVYDYLFRKYDPSAGRWLSPDPSGWDAVNPKAPQSLNRYAYVMNNPMSLSDPNGLDCIEPNGTVISGDCPEDANGNPTDNGVYIDCDGCVIAGTGTFDGNGDLNGYCTTGGGCFNGNGSPYVPDPDAPTFYANGWGTPLNDNGPPTEPYCNSGSPDCYPAAPPNCADFGSCLLTPQGPANPGTGSGSGGGGPTPLTPQQKHQQLKDKIGHGCIVVSGLLVVGDIAILVSGQEYLAPAAASLSLHVWAGCGLLTW